MCFTTLMEEKIEIAKDVLDDALGSLYLIDFNKLKIPISELSRRQTELIDAYTDEIIKILNNKNLSQK